MPYLGWVPRCAVCRNSVNLRLSKTNEYGRAVHEHCYVWKLLSKKPTTSLSAGASARRNFAGATVPTDCQSVENCSVPELLGKSGVPVVCVRRDQTGM